MESSQKSLIGFATFQLLKYPGQNKCTEIPSRKCDGKNQIFVTARGAKASSCSMKE